MSVNLLGVNRVVRKLLSLLLWHGRPVLSSDLERTVVIISVKSAKELKLNASKESTLFMGKFILLELVLCSIIEIKPANVWIVLREGRYAETNSKSIVFQVIPY